MRYHIEGIFAGVAILVLGLTFGGFQTKDLPPADAHQNEVVRLLAAAATARDAVVPEPPSYERSFAPSEQLSPQELKNLLYDVGFRGEALRQAWGTAMKESTGRPMAHNQNSNTGDNSYGLFQINMIGNLGPARLAQYELSSNEDLFNPLTNAKIAYKMSNGGENWSAWRGLTDSTLKWMKEFPE
jgi:hypothetical protein